MTLVAPQVTLSLLARASATTTEASGRVTIGAAHTETLTSDVAFALEAVHLVAGQNVQITCSNGLTHVYYGYSYSLDGDAKDWEGNDLPAMATWDAVYFEAAATNTGVCTVSFANDQTQLELGPGEKALLLKSISTANSEALIITGPASGADAVTVTVLATAA